MPLSKAHKARTREKIVDVAADLFRKRGYDGVGLDTIMREAGLTHGGFYAHFRSKAALLKEVLASRHDLIQRLSNRDSDDTAGLNQEGAEVFGGYLDPNNLQKTAPNCTLSSLSLDAVRNGAQTKRAYTNAIERLLGEIGRGFEAEDVSSSITTNIAALSIGALSLARASDDPELGSAILKGARDQVRQWFDDLNA